MIRVQLFDSNISSLYIKPNPIYDSLTKGDLKLLTYFSVNPTSLNSDVLESVFAEV